jgi:hypothetical protein
MGVGPSANANAEGAADTASAAAAASAEPACTASVNAAFYDTASEDSFLVEPAITGGDLADKMEVLA